MKIRIKKIPQNAAKWHHAMGGQLNKYESGGTERTDYGLDPEYQANAEQQLGSNWANILGLHNINPTGDYGDYDQGRPQTTRLPISTPQSPVIAPQPTPTVPRINPSSNLYQDFSGPAFNNGNNQSGPRAEQASETPDYWYPNSPEIPFKYQQKLQIEDPNRLNPNGIYTPSPKTQYKTKGQGYTPDAGLLRYAKPIADLAGYLSKPEHINPSKYNTKIGNAKHVSDDASRRQNLGDYYTALYALKNSGNYSGRSQVALMRERMKADDKSVEWKNNTNAGIDNEYLSKVLANDQSNKKMEAGVDALNSQAKANKNLFGQQFAVDLSNIGEQEYIKKNYPEYYKKNKARRGGRLAKSIFKY